MLSLPQLLGLGSLGAGGLLTGKAYQRLGDIGEQARRESSELAETGMEQSRFRPFTVTTGTGGALTTTPEGGLTVGLSPQEQAMQQQLFGGAGQFFEQAQAPRTTREQEIFDRIRAVQSPEEQRQRLALEERLAAQGRLGVQTAQFGGAPEQFAMARAQEEAQNMAALQAMQQAQAEQMQQANLGQQMLGLSYLPQGQLLAATQPSQQLASQQAALQQYGAGLFGETAMSGLEQLLLQERARANLLGQVGGPMLNKAFTVPQGGGSGASIGGGSGGLFDFLGITDQNNDGTWWSRLFGG